MSAGRRLREDPPGRLVPAAPLPLGDRPTYCRCSATLPCLLLDTYIGTSKVGPASHGEYYVSKQPSSLAAHFRPNWLNIAEEYLAI